MSLYTVTWIINVDADTPIEAAEKALEIQRDPNSFATHFTVEAFGSGTEVDIDLGEVE